MQIASVFKQSIIFGLIVFLSGFVSGCGPIETTRTDAPMSEEDQRKFRGKDGEETIFDSIFSSSSGVGDQGGGIGVNSFLWRATLDTISFMPVTSADAFGGVVLTDWRSSSDAPNERFKMNIYLLGRSLRADGIRVAVFRQVLENSVWRDADVPDETRTKIEDAILTRARQLRNEMLSQQ